MPNVYHGVYQARKEPVQHLWLLRVLFDLWVPVRGWREDEGL